MSSSWKWEEVRQAQLSPGGRQSLSSHWEDLTGPGEQFSFSLTTGPLTLALPGPLLLFPPFFSSPEATVTVTWLPLLAPSSQGLPWAGPLTSFGKSGLFEIKEKACHHCLSPLHPLLVPWALLKVQSQKGPATPGVKQMGEQTRDPFVLVLRRVPAFHLVPREDKGCGRGTPTWSLPVYC